MFMISRNRPLIQSRFSGRGYISGEEAGIVNIKGVPARRRVYVYDIKTMLPVRDTWSNERGEYVLPRLDTRRTYIVMVIDHEGKYDPVCYSHITPYQPTD